MFDMILLKFFAQGTAIDPEAGSGSGLIVIAMAQYGFQHGLFDFGNHGIEQVTGQLAIKIIQVRLNRLLYRLL